MYSYGIVLWELWTGREPFEGLNYHALLHQMTSAGEAMRPPLPGCPDWDAAQVRTQHNFLLPRTCWIIHSSPCHSVDIHSCDPRCSAAITAVIYRAVLASPPGSIAAEF